MSSTPETKTIHGRECVTHHNACDCREAMFAARDEEVKELQRLNAELVGFYEDAQSWRHKCADALLKNDRLTDALQSMVEIFPDELPSDQITTYLGRPEIEELRKCRRLLALKVHGGG